MDEVNATVLLQPSPDVSVTKSNDLAWREDESPCCDAERMRRNRSSSSVWTVPQVELLMMEFLAVSAAAQLRTTLRG